MAKSHMLVDKRRHNLEYFNRNMPNAPGLTVSKSADYVKQSYYAAAYNYGAEISGISRNTLLKALRAELPETELREGQGPLISGGYVKPIYLNPMFQKQIAYGEVGCPFKCPHYKGQIDNSAGICPEVERAHATIITHEYMQPSLNETDIDDVLKAFEKVADNLDSLREYSVQDS